MGRCQEESLNPSYFPLPHTPPPSHSDLRRAAQSTEDPENRAVLSCTCLPRVGRVFLAFALTSQSPPSPNPRRVKGGGGRVPCLHLHPVSALHKTLDFGRGLGTGRSSCHPKQSLLNKPRGVWAEEESRGLRHHIQTSSGTLSSRGVVRKGPLASEPFIPEYSLPPSIIRAASTSGTERRKLRALDALGKDGRGPLALAPHKSRDPSTLNQKLTQAAPTSGAGPGKAASSQQLSGTDGLEDGEDRSHQLPSPTHA